MNTITINPEFQALIHPLIQEEKMILERDMLDKGCLDALKTWNGYLIDGHHRYAICQKHGLPFKMEELDFADEEDVKLWMIDNQMGRRNMTDAARIRYALLRSDIEKERAQKRMLSGKKQDIDPSPDLVQGSKGKVTAIIAKEIRLVAI